MVAGQDPARRTEASRPPNAASATRLAWTTPSSESTSSTPSFSTSSAANAALATDAAPSSRRRAWTARARWGRSIRSASSWLAPKPLPIRGRPMNRPPTYRRGWNEWSGNHVEKILGLQPFLMEAGALEVRRSPIEILAGDRAERRAFAHSAKGALHVGKPDQLAVGWPDKCGRCRRKRRLPPRGCARHAAPALPSRRQAPGGVLRLPPPTQPNPGYRYKSPRPAAIVSLR